MGHEKANVKIFETTNLKANEIALIEELGKGKKQDPLKPIKARVIYCEDSDDEKMKRPVVNDRHT